MDFKSKVFFIVFFLLVVGAVGATYFRYFMVRDYMIEAQASCDPYTEACFVHSCDSDTEDCTGDPEEDTSYYSIIHRNAQYMPICDPADENCDALTCPPGEAQCTITLCNDETVTDGDSCNDPESYTALHPQDSEEGGDTSVDTSIDASTDGTTDTSEDTAPEFSPPAENPNTGE